MKMKRLTNEELAKIRERADKVAGGKLGVILREGKPIEIVNEHSEWIADVGVTEDADFILASYEDIPKLLSEIERLQERSGDASRILGLDTEIIERQEAEIERLQAERDELYSIALWVTRRMPSPYYKNYVYDMIDKATGTESERV